MVTVPKGSFVGTSFLWYLKGKETARVRKTVLRRGDDGGYGSKGVLRRYLVLVVSKRKGNC